MGRALPSRRAAIQTDSDPATIGRAPPCATESYSSSVPTRPFWIRSQAELAIPLARTGQFQWRNPKLQFSRLKPCPLWSSPEGKWRCTVAKFEIRRIVRELKKQRCQIEQAIVALEGVEKRPLKRYARKARPRLQALPSIQLQSERKGQLVPFIRPAIVG
jgi:hypothetical protein